jgi:hypothetical protein
VPGNMSVMDGDRRPEYVPPPRDVRRLKSRARVCAILLAVWVAFGLAYVPYALSGEPISVRGLMLMLAVAAIFAAGILQARWKLKKDSANHGDGPVSAIR